MTGIRQRFATARQIARIARHTVRDSLTRPLAREAGDIPASVASLTTEWLNATLAPQLGAVIRAFRVEKVSDGSTSRARLHLEYKGAAEADAPPSVFIKSTSSFRTRLHVGATGAAGVEARFYREIRPTIDVSAPQGYLGVADRRTGRSMLFLEDLARSRSVQFGDILSRRISLVQAESMIDTLADAHGALYASARFETDLRWMVTSLRLQEGINRLSDFQRRTVVGFNRSADVMPSSIRAARDTLHDKLMASVSLDATAALGLNHSDVHAGNWFLHGDEQMGLFDWAIIAKGQGTRDLAYAMMSNLGIEDRRNWERDLVARYAARLSEVSGVAQTEDATWLSYRQQTMHGFCYWLYTIGSGTFQPNMQSEAVSLANIARMSQAVVDLETLDVLP